MMSFGEDRLGKGVVVAKDTPNFIANRIGTYGLLVTLREMEKRGYSIGEVDSVTGTLIGTAKISNVPYIGCRRSRYIHACCEERVRQDGRRRAESFRTSIVHEENDR